MINLLLAEYIVNSHDPEDLCRILGVSCEELLEAFPEKLEDNVDKFEGWDDA